MNSRRCMGLVPISDIDPSSRSSGAKGKERQYANKRLLPALGPGIPACGPESGRLPGLTLAVSGRFVKAGRLGKQGLFILRRGRRLPEALRLRASLRPVFVTLLLAKLRCDGSGNNEWWMK